MLLITPQLASKDCQNLSKVAIALGWSVHQNDVWYVPERLKNEVGAVVGTEVFCGFVADQMNWGLLSNPIDWLTFLPEEYVSRKITTMTAGEVRKSTTENFVKSLSKTWSTLPRVFQPGKFPEYIPNEAPVLVSDVLQHTSKYRCFVKDRKVIAGSCYWLKTRQMETAKQSAEIGLAKNYHNNYDDVVMFVDTMLQDDRVPCVAACVIDVMRFDKDKYAVIDSSPAYTTEPYGCELVAVLDAVKTSSIPRKN
jgi:hypothetical protein